MTPDEIAARMDGRITEAGPLRAEAFLPSPVVQNHASFLQWLPDGTLACAWFAGTLEGKPDIFIRAATLAPGAEEWSQSNQVSDDPARSEQNPVLFPDPQGDAVWLFHTAQPGGGRQEECEVMLRPLETAPSGWRSGPGRSLGLPLGSFVRARVVVRDDGAWLLPLFLCKGLSGARWTGSHDTAAVAVSTDRGATWSLAEVPESTGCVHMTIVPLGGERMVAFFRRRQADFVYRTESADGGRSWSTPEATDVPNNNSSIAAIRLADERIALLCNPVSAAQFSERRASLYDELGEDDDRARSDRRRRGDLGRAPRPALALPLGGRGPVLPGAPRGRRRSGDLSLQRPARRPQQGAILSGDGAGAGRKSSSRVHVPPSRDQIRPARGQLDRPWVTGA